MDVSNRDKKRGGSGHGASDGGSKGSDGSSYRNVNDLYVEDENVGGQFKFLNVNDIKFSQTIAFFGTRGSGKTTATMNILLSKRMRRGIVMCPTPEAICTYSDVIPLGYIYDYFDEQVLCKIMNYQYALKLRLHHQWQKEMSEMEAAAAIDRKNRWLEREARLAQRQKDENLTAREVEVLYEREIYEEEFENQQNLAMRISHGRTRKDQINEPHSMFCVLDDLSSDPDAMRSKVLKKLMDNGRHYLMLLLIICQYSIDFPAKCRGGLDWVVIFFDTLAPNLKRLYENYVGEFPDRHIFSEVLAECARRNACLVINKRSKSTNIYDKVFLFAPKELWISTTFIGDPQFAYVSDMYFSEKKFGASMAQGGGSAGLPDPTKKKKSETSKSAASKTSFAGKSFSIESIERKALKSKGSGKLGGGGGAGGGGGGKSSKKLADGGPYSPHDLSNSWDDDEDDPEGDRKRKEELHLKQNIKTLRQNLKRLGKQAQENSQNSPQESSGGDTQLIQNSHNSSWTIPSPPGGAN
jgi:hypothetical protein